MVSRLEGKERGNVGQKVQLSVVRQILSRDLMYSLVTAISTTISYLLFAKRIGLKHSHHEKKKKRSLCELMTVLLTLLVIIISQCMCVC